MSVKLPEYAGIATLQAYVIASQDEARCWLWLRAADKVMPELPAEISGLERTVDIPTLGVSLALEEVYRGIVR